MLTSSAAPAKEPDSRESAVPIFSLPRRQSTPDSGNVRTSPRAGPALTKARMIAAGLAWAGRRAMLSDETKRGQVAPAPTPAWQVAAQPGEDPIAWYKDQVLSGREPVEKVASVMDTKPKVALGLATEDFLLACIHRGRRDVATYLARQWVVISHELMARLIEAPQELGETELVAAVELLAANCNNPRMARPSIAGLVERDWPVAMERILTWFPRTTGQLNVVDTRTGARLANSAKSEAMQGVLLIQGGLLSSPAELERARKATAEKDALERAEVAEMEREWRREERAQREAEAEQYRLEQAQRYAETMAQNQERERQRAALWSAINRGLDNIKEQAREQNAETLRAATEYADRQRETQERLEREQREREARWARERSQREERWALEQRRREQTPRPPPVASGALTASAPELAPSARVTTITSPFSAPAAPGPSPASPTVSVVPTHWFDVLPEGEWYESSVAQSLARARRYSRASKLCGEMGATFLPDQFVNEGLQSCQRRINSFSEKEEFRCGWQHVRAKCQKATY